MISFLQLRLFRPLPLKAYNVIGGTAFYWGGGGGGG